VPSLCPANYARMYSSDKSAAVYQVIAAGISTSRQNVSYRHRHVCPAALLLHQDWE
jgi:hypothetical protein